MCPLCGLRKARRSCPALGKQICAVCCGTKRLVEIECPADCSYLSAAREHPPAVAVRQQQQDFGHVVQFLRDLNERQSQLFLLIAGFLVRYEPPELHAVIDDDVVDAARSLAATLETSARGVIYEHRAGTLAAERLVVALKPILSEVGKHGGSAFERDAAVVLRRIEESARDARGTRTDNQRAFLDLLGRVIKKKAEEQEEARPEADLASRLIVP